jgi:glc operon protein GlcG
MRRRIAIAVVFGLVAGSALAQAAAQGRGAAPPAPAPPNAPVPGPTYADAQKALAAAWSSAEKINVKLSCAVVDSRGDLVSLGRMDGARFQTTDVARGKALASAMFGQPSGALGAFANSPFFQNLNTAAQGRLYPIQGAVPVMKNNQVFGAVGCSGATSQQDEDAAKAGVATF